MSRGNRVCRTCRTTRMPRGRQRLVRNKSCVSGSRKNDTTHGQTGSTAADRRRMSRECYGETAAVEFRLHRPVRTIVVKASHTYGCCSGVVVSSYRARELRKSRQHVVFAARWMYTSPWQPIFGPIPWSRSGPLCHALSFSLSSWTSMRRRRATVPLATPGEWA